MRYISKYGLKIVVEVLRCSDKYVWFDYKGIRYRYKSEKFYIDFYKFDE